jgi:hypothetical protein
VSTADNRKLAEELFARLSAGDVPGALATMTDDATWLAAGRRELLPAAGNYNKEKLGRFFNPMLNIERILALTLLLVAFAAGVNALLLALDRRLHAHA